MKNISEDSTEDSPATASETHVTVCDINQAMLDVGKAKAENLGFQHGQFYANRVI